MRIIKRDQTTFEKVLDDAAQVIQRGGLVVSPTDTVYGLCASATHEEVVKKVIAFKQRPTGKAISVFVENLEEATRYVNIGDREKTILRKLFPGPFTAILPSKRNVCRLLQTEKHTLGIRIPRYDFITALTRKVQIPLTATSANLSGDSPHYSVEAFIHRLSPLKKTLIDLVIDAGKLPKNKPSTVIDLTGGDIKIMRHGDRMVRTYTSKSPSNTKKIAQSLFVHYKNEANKRSLVFLIEGELGVGKTIFTKAIGESLGVRNIVSPTYVIYYEYDTKDQWIKHLYHFDLYKIAESEEFKQLKVERLLTSHGLFCIEWGEKSTPIVDLLRAHAKIVYITMTYIGEHSRRIEVFEDTI